MSDLADGRAATPVVASSTFPSPCVAERGPEPARYAFTNCRVLFAREAESLICHAHPVYQEHERLEKMRSFVSQLPVHLLSRARELSRNPWC